MILTYAIIGLIIGLPLILAGGLIGAVIGTAWGLINVARWRRQQRKSLQGVAR